ncbi:MAG: DUF2344 domain-containing protein [Propionibacterium sp.]|nr:DUF2344 domain-containing protein [Propionibacterium sp.]
MSTRKQPPQQPPPVQKLRLRYTKRGAARFTSHRDFGRALERALRRADVPMAYSSGFNPHPRIAYANAAPTSAASEAEYFELGLAEVCDPAKVVDALNESLPTGFDILDCAEATKASLGDLLTASDWTMSLGGADEDRLADAVARFLAEEAFTVERMTKNGLRTFDARGAVIACDVDGSTITVRITHTAPLVRPDDLLTALRTLEPGLPERAMLTRTAQGSLVDGEIADPLRPA